MNAKAEQATGLGAADIGKLALALALLVAGIAGFYYFANAAQALRVLGLLAAFAAAVALAAFTAPGRAARHFLSESQFELRKVVWPTRDETLKTTLVILAVVVVLSLLLGLIDVILKWVILDHLLKIGK